MHIVCKLGVAAASLGLAVFAGYGLHALAEGAPTMAPLFYAGTLEADGKLATGLHTIALAVFELETGGAPLCTSETTRVPVEMGRFRIEVSADCVATMKARPDVWVALKFTGTDGVPHELPDRTKVGAVPYALEARHALDASHALKADNASLADKAALADRATLCDAAAKATQCEAAAQASAASGALATRLTDLESRLTALESFRRQITAAITVEGNLTANNNTVGPCTWSGWVDGGDPGGDSSQVSCPDGKFVAGIQIKNTPGVNTSIDMVNVLCCEL